MDKLKINLIPPEIKERAKKQQKKARVIKVSVGILVVLIVITIALIGGVVLQNGKLQSLNNELEQQRTQISQLKDNEATIFFLKNRIDTINQYDRNKYPQGEVFELMRKLIPPGINMTYLQVNKTETVSFQGDTVSSAALELFFNNLMNPAKNEGRIAGVSVDSLSKTQAGSIVFDLKIKLSSQPK